MLNIVNRPTLCFLLCTIAIVLSACSNQSSQPSMPSKPDSLSVVNIGNITSIPILSSQKNKVNNTHLTVTNTSELDLKLVNFYWQSSNNAKSTKPSADGRFKINTEKCNNLLARSDCILGVTVPSIPGSYLIKLEFIDKDQQHYFATQIIGVEMNLPSLEGFTYSTTNSQLAARDTTVSVPILLDNDYTNIQIDKRFSNTKVVCEHGQYTKNTLCTLLVKLTKRQLFGGNTLDIQVAGILPNSKKSYANIKLIALSVNTAAVLITSGINVVLSPSSTATQQVFLYNNGNASALSVTLTNQYPIIIGTNTCTATLGSGSTCSFFVSSGVSASGTSSTLVTYNNGSSLQQLSFNIIYLSAVPGPSLSLTTSGSLQNNYTGNHYLIKLVPILLYL